MSKKNHMFRAWIHHYPDGGERSAFEFGWRNGKKERQRLADTIAQQAKQLENLLNYQSNANVHIKEQAEQIKALKLDADRYRFLRDSDSWGEDSGENNWEALVESTMCVFDEIVDSRKLAFEALPPTPTGGE